MRTYLAASTASNTAASILAFNSAAFLGPLESRFHPAAVSRHPVYIGRFRGGVGSVSLLRRCEVEIRLDADLEEVVVCLLLATALSWLSVNSGPERPYYSSTSSSFPISLPAHCCSRRLTMEELGVVTKNDGVLLG